MLHEDEFKGALSGSIGFYEQSSTESAILALKSLKNIGFEDPGYFKSIQDIIIDKTEYTLVDLNDSVEAISLPDSFFTFDGKSKLF